MIVEGGQMSVSQIVEKQIIAQLATPLHIINVPKEILHKPLDIQMLFRDELKKSGCERWRVHHVFDRTVMPPYWEEHPPKKMHWEHKVLCDSVSCPRPALPNLTIRKVNPDTGSSTIATAHKRCCVGCPIHTKDCNEQYKAMRAEERDYHQHNHILRNIKHMELTAIPGGRKVLRPNHDAGEKVVRVIEDTRGAPAEFRQRPWAAMKMRNATSPEEARAHGMCGMLCKRRASMSSKDSHCCELCVVSKGEKHEPICEICHQASTNGLTGEVLAEIGNEPELVQMIIENGNINPFELRILYYGEEHKANSPEAKEIINQFSASPEVAKMMNEFTDMKCVDREAAWKIVNGDDTEMTQCHLGVVIPICCEIGAYKVAEEQMDDMNHFILNDCDKINVTVCPESSMMMIGMAPQAKLMPMVKRIAEECLRRVLFINVSVQSLETRDGQAPFSIFRYDQGQEARWLGIATFNVRRMTGFSPTRGARIMPSELLDETTMETLKKVAKYDLDPYLADMGKNHVGYKYFGPRGPPDCMAVYSQVMNGVPPYVWNDEMSFCHGARVHIEPEDDEWVAVTDDMTDHKKEEVYEDNFRLVNWGMYKAIHLQDLSAFLHQLMERNRIARSIWCQEENQRLEAGNPPPEDLVKHGKRLNEKADMLMNQYYYAFSTRRDKAIEGFATRVRSDKIFGPDLNIDECTEEELEILYGYMRYVTPELTTRIFSESFHRAMFATEKESVEELASQGLSEPSITRLSLAAETPHKLAVGDQVLVRMINMDVKTQFIYMMADRTTDSWYPAVVQEVNQATGVCTVRLTLRNIRAEFGLSGKKLRLTAEHVVFAPGRSSSWGTGELQGNVLPANARRVQIGVPCNMKEVLPINFPSRRSAIVPDEYEGEMCIVLPDFVRKGDQPMQIMSYTEVEEEYLCLRQCPTCGLGCLHLWSHEGHPCVCANGIGMVDGEHTCEEFSETNDSSCITVTPCGRASAVQLEINSLSDDICDWVCENPPNYEAVREDYNHLYVRQTAQEMPWYMCPTESEWQRLMGDSDLPWTKPFQGSIADGVLSPGGTRGTTLGPVLGCGRSYFENGVVMTIWARIPVSMDVFEAWGVPPQLTEPGGNNAIERENGETSLFAYVKIWSDGVLRANLISVPREVTAEYCQASDTDDEADVVMPETCVFCDGECTDSYKCEKCTTEGLCVHCMKCGRFCWACWSGLPYEVRLRHELRDMNERCLGAGPADQDAKGKYQEMIGKDDLPDHLADVAEQVGLEEELMVTPEQIDMSAEWWLDFQEYWRGRPLDELREYIEHNFVNYHDPETGKKMIIFRAPNHQSTTFLVPMEELEDNRPGNQVMVEGKCERYISRTALQSRRPSESARKFAEMCNRTIAAGNDSIAIMIAEEKRLVTEGNFPPGGSVALENHVIVRVKLILCHLRRTGDNESGRPPLILENDKIWSARYDPETQMRLSEFTPNIFGRDHRNIERRQEYRVIQAAINGKRFRVPPAFQLHNRDIVRALDPLEHHQKYDIRDHSFYTNEQFCIHSGITLKGEVGESGVTDEYGMTFKVVYFTPSASFYAGDLDSEDGRKHKDELWTWLGHIGNIPVANRRDLEVLVRGYQDAMKSVVKVARHAVSKWGPCRGTHMFKDFKRLGFDVRDNKNRVTVACTSSQIFDLQGLVELLRHWLPTGLSLSEQIIVIALMMVYTSTVFRGDDYGWDSKPRLIPIFEFMLRYIPSGDGEVGTYEQVSSGIAGAMVAQGCEYEHAQRALVIAPWTSHDEIKRASCWAHQSGIALYEDPSLAVKHGLRGQHRDEVLFGAGEVGSVERGPAQHGQTEKDEYYGRYMEVRLNPRTIFSALTGPEIPLRRDEHWMRQFGQMIEVETETTVQGRTNWATNSEVMGFTGAQALLCQGTVHMDRIGMLVMCHELKVWDSEAKEADRWPQCPYYTKDNSCRSGNDCAFSHGLDDRRSRSRRTQNGIRWVTDKKYEAEAKQQSYGARHRGRRGPLLTEAELDKATRHSGDEPLPFRLPPMHMAKTEKLALAIPELSDHLVVGYALEHSRTRTDSWQPGRKVYDRRLELHFFNPDILLPKFWPYRHASREATSIGPLLGGQPWDFPFNRVFQCCYESQCAVWTKCMNPRCKAYNGAFIYLWKDGIQVPLWDEQRGYAELRKTSLTSAEMWFLGLSKWLKEPCLYETNDDGEKPRYEASFVSGFAYPEVKDPNSDEARRRSAMSSDEIFDDLTVKIAEPVTQMEIVDTKTVNAPEPANMGEIWHVMTGAVPRDIVTKGMCGISINALVALVEGDGDPKRTWSHKSNLKRNLKQYAKNLEDFHSWCTPYYDEGRVIKQQVMHEGADPQTIDVPAYLYAVISALRGYEPATKKKCCLPWGLWGKNAVYALPPPHDRPDIWSWNGWKLYSYDENGEAVWWHLKPNARPFYGFENREDFQGLEDWWDNTFDLKNNSKKLDWYYKWMIYFTYWMVYQLNQYGPQNCPDWMSVRSNWMTLLMDANRVWQEWKDMDKHVWIKRYYGDGNEKFSWFLLKNKAHLKQLEKQMTAELTSFLYHCTWEEVDVENMPRERLPPQVNDGSQFDRQYNQAALSAFGISAAQAATELALQEGADASPSGASGSDRPAGSSQTGHNPPVGSASQHPGTVPNLMRRMKRFAVAGAAVMAKGGKSDRGEINLKTEDSFNWTLLWVTLGFVMVLLGVFFFLGYKFASRRAEKEKQRCADEAQEKLDNSSMAFAKMFDQQTNTLMKQLRAEGRESQCLRNRLMKMTSFKSQLGYVAPQHFSITRHTVGEALKSKNMLRSDYGCYHLYRNCRALKSSKGSPLRFKKCVHCEAAELSGKEYNFNVLPDIFESIAANEDNNIIDSGASNSLMTATQLRDLAMENATEESSGAYATASGYVTGSESGFTETGWDLVSEDDEDEVDNTVRRVNSALQDVLEAEAAVSRMRDQPDFVRQVRDQPEYSQAWNDARRVAEDAKKNLDDARAEAKNNKGLRQAVQQSINEIDYDIEERAEVERRAIQQKGLQRTRVQQSINAVEERAEIERKAARAYAETRVQIERGETTVVDPNSSTAEVLEASDTTLARPGAVLDTATGFWSRAPMRSRASSSGQSSNNPLQQPLLDRYAVPDFTANYNRIAGDGAPVVPQPKRSFASSGSQTAKAPPPTLTEYANMTMGNRQDGSFSSTLW